jgi:2-polyprenyl-3-methyl-5-hydroxy-6-metoxy-1,4-benzoquinol methylase
MQIELIDRAMQASRRQVEIRTVEKFRCKEPLAMELSRQLKEAVPLFCSEDAKDQLIDFSSELKQWLDVHRRELDTYLGPSLISPMPNSVNKPQPHFTEAVFATLIRCEVIATYAKYLKSLNIGCILGGSLSYGKFFNVRQSLERSEIGQQSDIDILLVTNLNELDNKISGREYETISEITQRRRAAGNAEPLDTPLALIFGLQPLIDIARTIAREADLDYERVVLTKKYRTNLSFNIGKLFYPEVKGFPFILSVHIVSPQLFDNLTNPLTISEYEEQFGTEPPTIVDIRVDSVIRDILVYGTMEGTIVPESVSRIDREHKEYDFGYEKSEVALCKIPLYFYWENRYVSGIYQNLIIPAFEVICDSKERTIASGITNFKHFLTEEVLREKAHFRDSNLSLSKLHPRHPIFLQSISDSFDQVGEKQITSKTAEIISSYKEKQRLDVRKSFHAKYGSDFNLSNEVIKEMHQHFGTELKHLSILELGCGSGDFLLEMHRNGHKGDLVGIDVVPPGSADKLDDRIDMIVGDVNRLTSLLHQHGHGNKRFDVILAIHVLYHIQNVPPLLETITQWLSRDGVFITTANSNQNFHRLSRIFRDALFRIGYNFSPDRRYTQFSADNATEVMREYFKSVRHTVTETDIKVTDMEDVVGYLESSYDNYSVPESTDLRRRLSGYIRESLEEWTKLGLTDRRIVSVTSGTHPIRYIQHDPLLTSY